MDKLTPVQNIGNFLWKRDDLFRPFHSDVNGSKLRQLLWLMTRKPITGVVGGAVQQSPQHLMMATVARELGIPCTLFCGTSLPKAEELGAKVQIIAPGYAGNLNSHAKKLAQERDWLHIETNITISDPQLIEPFHLVGSEQCRNIPDSVENLFIPAGSCNSLTSVLYGLARFKPKSLKNVHLFRIMGDIPKHQRWVSERLKIIGVPKLHYNFVEHDLIDSGYTTYQKLMPYSFCKLILHARYEGKILCYIRDHIEQFRHLLNEKSLFWIVGGPVA